jgi:hypothetical protein
VKCLTVAVRAEPTNQVDEMPYRSLEKCTDRLAPYGSTDGVSNALLARMSRWGVSIIDWQSSSQGLAFGGMQISQMWTGTPFLALLMRCVTRVYLTGTSSVDSDPPGDD